jgi:isopentenyl-diphosphate delta-isomerase
MKRPDSSSKKSSKPKISWPGQQRQQDHLALAAQAQVAAPSPKAALNYEPLQAALPPMPHFPQTEFLGKAGAPLWISPLSLGPQSKKINQALAQACAEFKLGWMLGSLRSLLAVVRTQGWSAPILKDYRWREVVGHNHLWGNLGISQLALLVAQHDEQILYDLMAFLELDGLVVHLNPLQEWWQKEGDRYTQHPLDVLSKFLAAQKVKVIVKEVGQGLGPWSLARLGELPLAAIDLAGQGGTNFTRLEALRSGRPDFGLAKVGHSLEEMTAMICQQPLKTVKNFILSGGVREIPPVYQCHLQLKAVGAASVVALGYPLLGPARQGPAALKAFLAAWLHAWEAATRFLNLAGPGERI